MFRLDPDDTGKGEEWFRHPNIFSEHLHVPGTWQGQGFGGSGKDTIRDFNLTARTFRATYKGTGWYCKTFRVPREWLDGPSAADNTGRLWLDFGGAHPSAEVWLNGHFLGINELPFVPFGFDISQAVRPEAENVIVARIHEKHRELGFAFNFQGNWSGLYRGVDLRATGDAYLDRLMTHPSLDEEKVAILPTVGGLAAGQGNLTLLMRVLDGEGQTVAEETSTVSAAPSLNVKSAMPWSPDKPNLYRVDTRLIAADGHTLDARADRFGFVKLSTREKHFCVNDEPYYMRGTGDFVSCPETGSPDTDRDRWRRKLKTLREYGYNYVRSQSYVQSPEYLDAADEVGLLVQNEMGMLGAWGAEAPSGRMR